ncbi:MAG: NADH-quinone oxidoreductase subunit NuoH [Chloroflexi bacterium]|nr:NADH-quinone oxidoreductase subunit NuoH [Ardenticatenaceae bacterium]MBL1127014.1 NADH-quinone oxidoreductase subunit NuoH [Chloroflexota bacterium]NOG33073.1 NADH-quinone oxidoreductase subunit NuoH [Chloroflexota bacterium]GIK54628.1 MAG: NADH-quinone oxidoreductase subunit H [Chloroflexota bacterium]
MAINTLSQLAVYSLVVGFIMTFVVITGFAYTTLLERKLLARLQHRVGPNRAGYIPIPTRGGKERKLLGGFMQPAADAVKLFFKEDMTPVMVDKWTYFLAPIITVIPAIFILAVIPWAGFVPYITPEGRDYFAIAPGINVGVLFILAITSISVYGVVLAGWSSNSKYAILGGIRASAQMISYELAMGLTVLVPVMLANSMDLGVIVEGQRGMWYLFLQPIAALVFWIAALAELQRAPFDLLEAEQELSAGFTVEYSSMRFGMFFLAEYMKMIIFCALFAVFFLGGYRGPFVDQVPALGFVYTALKVFLGLCVMIWIRASLPRFRYDQLMSFGWKVLLPISVVNFMIVAVMIVLVEEGVLGF